MTTATAAKYETKSVKVIRGLEPRTRAKLEQEGWEFVSLERGTMRSVLNFRRPKAATPWKLIAVGGGLFTLAIAALLVGSVLGDDDTSGDSAETLPSSTPSSTPSQIEPTETNTPSDVPVPVAPVVTDITVDELLDKLNSAEMGGIEVGDRFRLTGELFMSDLWMTGAAGEYTVMLKAQGGAQDLSVFVDESEAAGWQDGTEVQMIVEMGEATINGETTDGWLRAVSAEVVP